MGLFVLRGVPWETEVDTDRFVHDEDVLRVAPGGVHAYLSSDGLPVVREVHSERAFGVVCGVHC